MRPAPPRRGLDRRVQEAVRALQTRARQEPRVGRVVKDMPRSQGPLVQRRPEAKVTGRKLANALRSRVY